VVPPIVVGLFLVAHGLITTMIGVGAVSNGPAQALPSWFGWWPGPFGRSWLIDGLHFGTPVAVAGGVVWLASGVLLIGAGLGYLGVGPLREGWPLLAVAGGALGLLAVAVYFHPLYLIAGAINLALLLLAWGRFGSMPLQP
jgi:hypothetical protein